MPDYSAVHHFMGWHCRREVRATHSGLVRFVAEQLRDKASISKEARKAIKERSLRAKPAKASTGGGKAGGGADA